MENQKKKSGPALLRISVDEILEPGLVRLLVCRLKKAKGTFTDQGENWEEEEGILVRQDNYLKKLNLPGLTPKNLPWKDFREGSVYLAGAFEFRKPDRFTAVAGSFQVRRVDRIIKDRVKELYFRALAGKEKSHAHQ